jgi:hypothetical protein
MNAGCAGSIADTPIQELENGCIKTPRNPPIKQGRCGHASAPPLKPGDAIIHRKSSSPWQTAHEQPIGDKKCRK